METENQVRSYPFLITEMNISDNLYKVYVNIAFIVTHFQYWYSSTEKKVNNLLFPNLAISVIYL